MFPDVSAAVLPPVQPAGVPGQPHREPPGPGCGGGGDPCPKDCTLGQCGYWGYSSTYLIYFSPYSWDNFFLRVFILYSIFTDSFITGFHGIIKEMSHHMPSMSHHIPRETCHHFPTSELPHAQRNEPHHSQPWSTSIKMSNIISKEMSHTSSTNQTSHSWGNKPSHSH